MASKKRKTATKAPKKSAKKTAPKPAIAASKKRRSGIPPNKPIPHGTRTGYVNYKCRCPRCRKANTDYISKLTARKSKKAAAIPKGPHLNSAERALRDSLIVQRRAQNWPWEAIAEEMKLTVTATQKAYKRKVESLTPLMEVDATKILEGLIEGLQFSIGDLEQLAVAAAEERNMSAAVSAKRASNEAREKLQDLLQTTGLLPHDLGTIKHQIEFRLVVVEVVNLVHNFIGKIESLDLPGDKRPQVLEAADELTTGLEHLDGSTPSTNGGSNGTETSEKRPVDATGAATQGGGGDSPD